ncbi:hypothetical protein BH11ACT3_BH11ACT3_04410 [soil metagenome]
MGEFRERLSAAIATIEEFGEGLFELRLRPPASEEQIQAVEAEFGERLPEDLRELYLLHDGQDQLTATGHLFTGEPFATLARAIEAWRQNAEHWKLTPGHAERLNGYSLDPELRAVDADIRWFPFAVFNDELKQAYWVDMNPIPGRPRGQVIEEGAWAHPPQYIGPSVVDVLETIASGIRSGDVALTAIGSMSRWGFGPAAFPLQHVKGVVANPPTSYPSFLDDLPPEESAYLRTRGVVYSVLYGELRSLAGQLAAAGAPARVVPLLASDIAGTLPTTFEGVGDAQGRTEIALRHPTSLAGVEKYPIRTLTIVDGDGSTIDQLASSSSIQSVVITGGVPALSKVVPSVQSMSITLARASDFDLLDKLPALVSADLGLGELDPNDHDWSRLEGLGYLTLRGGRFRSLDFVASLPNLRHLRLKEPLHLGVSGVARGKLTFLEIVDAPIPDDIEELRYLTLPSLVVGPIEWFRRVEHVMVPGIFAGVLDKGDSSTYSELTRLNWDARREAFARAGLAFP